MNLRSLHVRLLLSFALVLVPAWALFAALAVGGARAYFEELTQRQNALLASNLVVEAAAKGDDVMSDDVVDMLAMANPGVEIYVLGVDGRVMAPPVVELANATVDLEPIERFIATTDDGALRPLPIRGTDPRGSRPVVFSAAPLDDGSGYLYVVLTDAPRSTLAGSVGGSATLGLVVSGGALGLLVAIGAGALVFALLTRRLRAVADGVRAYDPKRPEVLTVRAPARPAGDEVDDVASGVGALMERVRDQVACLQIARRATIIRHAPRNGIWHPTPTRPPRHRRPTRTAPPPPPRPPPRSATRPPRSTRAPAHEPRPQATPQTARRAPSSARTRRPGPRTRAGRRRSKAAARSVAPGTRASARAIARPPGSRASARRRPAGSPSPPRGACGPGRSATATRPARSGIPDPTRSATPRAPNRPPRPPPPDAGIRRARNAFARPHPLPRSTPACAAHNGSVGQAGRAFAGRKMPTAEPGPSGTNASPWHSAYCAAGRSHGPAPATTNASRWTTSGAMLTRIIHER